ncbi:hypothetical protein [Mesomycoplasma ovipneumoniae]
MPKTQDFFVIILSNQETRDNLGIQVICYINGQVPHSLNYFF